MSHLNRLGAVVLVLISMSLAACQPTVDERLEAARQHIAADQYNGAMVELKNVVQAVPDNLEAREMLADTAIIVGDLALAEAQYTRLLEVGETSARVWAGLGRALAYGGRSREAFERVVPNLLEIATAADHWVLIGDIYLSLGNTSEARASYARALDIDSRSVGASVGMAALAAAAGDNNEASRIIDAALTQNVDSPALWRAKGQVLKATRVYAGAITAFYEAVRLERADMPLADRFQARANLVTALVDDLRLDDAERELQRLRARFPGHPLASFLAGRIAFGRGDLEAAQVQFQNFLSREPNDPHAHAMMGAVTFSQSYYGQAEMWLTRAARAEIGGDSIRRLLAETKLRLNKPREALQMLESAAAEGRANTALLAMIGRAQLAVGDTESAIRYFEEGIRSDPENPLLAIALAANYIQAGRYGDGQQLLESLPDSDDSRYYKKALLIASYLRSGATEQAKAEAAQMLEEAPDDVLILAIAGTMWQSLGDIDTARSMFERILEVDPANATGLFSLGRLDIEERNLDAAAERFKEALRADPTFIPALDVLARIATATGTDDLEQWIMATVEATPSAVTPKIILARYQLAGERIADAQRVVDRLQEDFPGEPRVDHMQGAILLRSNRIEEAIPYLMRASRADDDNPEFLFDLANAQLTNAEFDSALANAKRFCGIRPNDRRGLSILTSSAISSNKPGEAMGPVRLYVERYPRDATVRMMLADLEWSSGLFDTALALYEEIAAETWSRQIAMKLSYARGATGTANASAPLATWLETNPDDSEARNHYASVLESEGNLDAAIAEYERLVSEGAANPAVLNNLAWRYFVDGRDEALALARQAYDGNDEDYRIADTYGWILVETGQLQDGLRVLQRASDLSGGDPEIQYHYASALARSGQGARAREILASVLAAPEPFPSRADAERLAESL